MNNSPKNERDFFWIARWATALAFGVLAGVLQSMRDERGSFHFDVSWVTILVFFIGAAIGWGLWKVVERKSLK